MKVQEISIRDYTYVLPDNRIARYPINERDASKLLTYRKGQIAHRPFYELADELPANALMVFNNTKVVRARLHFRKATGAAIELFCLDPIRPLDYQQAFAATGTCTWNCMVGNLKKWKTGVLQRQVQVKDQTVQLTAEKVRKTSDGAAIQFTWDHASVSFGELMESAGVLPIPPYLNRETESIDSKRYQTVYSRQKGSVAAPTAGLHFTPRVLNSLAVQNIQKHELTLHVGAGTFKPVQADTLADHYMHDERFQIPIDLLKSMAAQPHVLIAVGTTTVRTLESAYWLGVKYLEGQASQVLEQWDCYQLPTHYTVQEAFGALVEWLDKEDRESFSGETRLLIAPGYRYQVVNQLITNFHQPQSTLLLLVAALVGDDWRKIYDYALAHDFRFLSYGDSSLIIP